MAETGVIILAHGSRNECGVSEILNGGLRCGKGRPFSRDKGGMGSDARKAGENGLRHS